MIAYFLLGCALFAGTLLLIRWFVSTDPKQVVSVLRWISVLIGIGLALYLIWGGARTLAIIALPFLLPLLMRQGLLHNIIQRAKAARGPSPGQVSEVTTRFLRMTLDHDTGRMEGMVLEGEFRGRGLDELGEEELLQLWRLCRIEDEQSARILEAYLDRTSGGAWRQAAGAGPADEEAQSEAGRRGAAGGRMTRQEALDVLGLEEGAGEKEIRQAHHRLMQKLHPDRGGSNYLAAKINEAKDILLGH